MFCEYHIWLFIYVWIGIRLFVVWYCFGLSKVLECRSYILLIGVEFCEYLLYIGLLAGSEFIFLIPNKDLG